jgi:hypothetical protein
MLQVLGLRRVAAFLGVFLALFVSLGLGDAQAAPAPPLGKYSCYQSSSGVGWLYSGWFRFLSTSRYKVFSGAGGRYSYNASTRAVRWLSGPYKSYGWKGKYYPRGEEGRSGPTVILTGPDSIRIRCSRA